jgi:hypothetical protein
LIHGAADPKAVGMCIGCGGVDPARAAAGLRLSEVCPELLRTEMIRALRSELRRYECSPEDRLVVLDHTGEYAVVDNSARRFVDDVDHFG